MISKNILTNSETFVLIIQLTDIVVAAHERNDYENMNRALKEIKEIREQIKGQATESR
ncbi:MAG: hypothetical protein U9N40_07725 [Euryarchaeota archaeon]|nr:hypothetical protein [Euryarchaeota archaeon]